MKQHFLKSSFREKLIEHLFVGELLKHSWCSGECSLEISKPEVDNQGYDLIAETNGIIRHIQLKAAHLQAKAAKQKVHIALANKSSGCVIWIYFDEVTLELGPFLFFGSSPGEPLPDLGSFKVAKHTKADAKGIKAERPEIRVVPKRKFQSLDTIDDVFEVLFGSKKIEVILKLRSRHSLNKAFYSKSAAEKLKRIITNPTYVKNAQPWFARRDYWRTVNDSRFWKMLVSQVSVVGSSAGWELLKKSKDIDSALSLGVLLRNSRKARAKVINMILRKYGIRYVSAEVANCKKTRALVKNFDFITSFPGRTKGYLKELANLPDDIARVRRVSQDMVYIKNKGARDLLISLDLGRSLIAFDVRILNVLKAAGVNVPDDVQSNKQRYEELQSAILRDLCEPNGLSGAEFDRIVFRNYDAIKKELGMEGD